MRILFFLLFLSEISCGKGPSNKRCSEFGFTTLGSNSNLWKEEIPFKKVSIDFFDNRIKSMRDFLFYKSDSFYYVCILSNKYLDGDVIALVNGPQLEMFFISESSVKPFLVACTEVSPDDYREINSRLVGDYLEMTKVYSSTEGKITFKDSVYTRYELVKHNMFLKIKSDSIRTTIEF